MFLEFPFSTEITWTNLKSDVDQISSKESSLHNYQNRMFFSFVCFFVTFGRGSLTDNSLLYNKDLSTSDGQFLVVYNKDLSVRRGQFLVVYNKDLSVRHGQFLVVYNKDLSIRCQQILIAQQGIV